MSVSRELTRKRSPAPATSNPAEAPVELPMAGKENAPREDPPVIQLGFFYEKFRGFSIPFFIIDKSFKHY